METENPHFSKNQYCEDKQTLFMYSDAEHLKHSSVRKLSCPKPSPKIPNKKFHCELCDYNTSNLKDFNKHLQTRKHQETLVSKYKCNICDMTYNSKSGLWKHKKLCVIPKEKEPAQHKEQNQDKEIIHALIKSQNENMDKMTNMILELCKNGIINTTNTNSNINSHNNSQFNLNFFLNETCKNAMNITDFVDSIKLQVSDLERIGEEGFVEGMSNIIISNLNQLDETIRPIHCTDKKRETIYIKDENVWSKEDENQTRMRNTIKKLANKNIRMLPQYREKYPEHKNSYSKQSDIYDKLIIEVMSTATEDEDKIIKKITNATTIKKKN